MTTTRKRLAAIKAATSSKRVETHVRGRQEARKYKDIRDSLSAEDLVDTVPAWLIAVRRLPLERAVRKQMVQRIDGCLAAANDLRLLGGDVKLVEVRRKIIKANAFAGQIEDTLNRCFRERVKEFFELQKALGVFLQKFPNQQDVGSKISDAADAGLDAKKYDYSHGLDKYTKYRQRCDEIRAAAAGEGMDWTFLRELMEGTTSLLDITPERRKWLQDAGALGSIKLSLD